MDSSAALLRCFLHLPSAHEEEPGGCPRRESQTTTHKYSLAANKLLLAAENRAGTLTLINTIPNEALLLQLSAQQMCARTTFLTGKP